MRRKLAATWMAATGVALMLGGCVERRMTIRTNPPGALVYVDNKEMGVSPVSYSFVHYGTSRVRLVRDGYETQTVVEEVKAPVYEWLPLEPFSELLPFRFKDWREFTYDLETSKTPSIPDLRDRAEIARQDALTASEQPGRPGAAKPEVRMPQGKGVPALLDPEDPVWFQEAPGAKK
jgi:PEGA domain-containing protein